MTNFNFNMTFGGVPFVLPSVAKVIRMTQKEPDTEVKDLLPPRKYQPEPNLLDELNRLIPFHYLKDFSLTGSYPGRNLGAIAYKGNEGAGPSPELLIGDWYYPTDVSRWSIFRGIATSSQMSAMLVTTGGSSPATFVMNSQPIGASNPGSYLLQTSLYMLPARPLAEYGSQYDGLYLITLVDERYYFQGIPATLHPDQNSTWISLLNYLAEVLDIDLTIGSIPSVYSTPEVDSQLWSNEESAVILLDAIAGNLGSTIVRNFDGTYNLYNAVQSQTIVNTNRTNPAAVVRVAGGDLFGSGNTKAGDISPARNSVVPQQINISFPYYVIGNDPVPHFLNSRSSPQRRSCWYEESYGDVWTVGIPITSGGSLTSGLIGVGQETIQVTAKALISGENQITPLNASGLTALAMQIAQDRYNGQVASALDEVYPGTLAWQPDGIHDIIWTYGGKGRPATTRVIRQEWNKYVSEMQHASPPLSGFTNVPVGVGGPSVALTVKDSFSGNIFNSIASPLNSGDSQAILTSVNNFPTQNRWRGLVDSETILFEGTSGGISYGGGYLVNIVHRAIDGAFLASHNSGVLITQSGNDVSYGVNLITFEKGQFTFPAEWTSGGIQGVNVVPQTQTVKILSTSGQVVSQGTYYSGVVGIYNDVDQLEQQEFIWIMERNGVPPTSGWLYDGQLVGFGGPGNSGSANAPVYQVNDYIHAKSISITSNYQLSIRNNLTLIEVDATGGNVTIDARFINLVGYIVWIRRKDQTTNTVTFNTTALVDGINTGYPIVTPIYGVMGFFYTSTSSWSVFTKNPPYLTLQQTNQLTSTVSGTFNLVNQINYDLDTGLQLTPAGSLSNSGIVLLRVLPASLTQNGVITVNDQQIAGGKLFKDGITTNTIQSYNFNTPDNISGVNNPGVSWAVLPTIGNSGQDTLFLRVLQILSGGNSPLAPNSFGVTFDPIQQRLLIGGNFSGYDSITGSGRIRYAVIDPQTAIISEGKYGTGGGGDLFAGGICVGLNLSGASNSLTVNGTSINSGANNSFFIQQSGQLQQVSGGDLTIQSGGVTVSKLQAINVTTTPPTSGKLFYYNGTDAQLEYTAGGITATIGG